MSPGGSRPPAGPPAGGHPSRLSRLAGVGGTIIVWAGVAAPAPAPCPLRAVERPGGPASGPGCGPRGVVLPLALRGSAAGPPRPSRRARLRAGPGLGLSPRPGPRRGGPGGPPAAPLRRRWARGAAALARRPLGPGRGGPWAALRALRPPLRGWGGLGPLRASQGPVRAPPGPPCPAPIGRPGLSPWAAAAPPSGGRAGGGHRPPLETPRAPPSACG